MPRMVNVALALTSLAAAGQIRLPKDATVPIVPPALTLEVQRSEGGVSGDIAIPEEWVTSLSIPVRGVLRFRFGIKETGITLQGPQPHAQWRIYEGPPPPNDRDGTAKNIRARGDAGEMPTTLQPRTFVVDFAKALPPFPDKQPYYINVTARNADGTFSSRVSPYVVITYAKSTFGQKVEIDSVKVVSVVPQGGKLNAKYSVFEPLTAANSIEVTFDYALVSTPKGSIKWWMLDPGGGSMFQFNVIKDDWINVSKGKGVAKGRMGLRCPDHVTFPLVAAGLEFGLFDVSTPLASGKVALRPVTFICKP